MNLYILCRTKMRSKAEQGGGGGRVREKRKQFFFVHSSKQVAETFFFSAVVADQTLGKLNFNKLGNYGIFLLSALLWLTKLPPLIKYAKEIKSRWNVFSLRSCTLRKKKA
jgi:hypothetical protein